jgi:hypothetical protein
MSITKPAATAGSTGAPAPASSTRQRPRRERSGGRARPTTKKTTPPATAEPAPPRQTSPPDPTPPRASPDTPDRPTQSSGFFRTLLAAAVLATSHLFWSAAARPSAPRWCLLGAVAPDLPAVARATGLRLAGCPPQDLLAQPTTARPGGKCSWPRTACTRRCCWPRCATTERGSWLPAGWGTSSWTRSPTMTTPGRGCGRCRAALALTALVLAARASNPPVARRRAPRSCLRWAPRPLPRARAAGRGGHRLRAPRQPARRQAATRTGGRPTRPRARPQPLTAAAIRCCAVVGARRPPRAQRWPPPRARRQ